MENPDYKGLVEKNPRVDAAQFAEVCRILGELRRHGFHGADYNLPLPFTPQIRILEKGEETKGERSLLRYRRD